MTWKLGYRLSQIRFFKYLSKNKKTPETSSHPMLSIFFEFFDKDFLYVIAMKLAKLYHQAVFPKLISKIYFLFHT